MCHSGCVILGSEYRDGVVGGRAEGFHSFVGLLAVVEAGGHAVDGEVGGGYEGWFGPLAGFDAVVGFDVAVYWELLAEVEHEERFKRSEGVEGTFSDAESNVAPVDCIDGWWWEGHFECRVK